MNAFEVRDPAFHDVIPSDVRLEVLAEGFGFTEGAIWHPDEHWLVFSDIITSVQYRWSEADGISVFRRPSNQANGNCFDREGRVLTCEHAASQVVRHEHDGKLVRPIATHFEGRELNSPNDIVCDGKGRIWFTDPAFGRTREELGILRKQELHFQGVYRLDPDGTLTAVVRDFKAPNGLCLSLDETQLYVNDSKALHIRLFDIDEDGSLVNGRVWADVTGDQPPQFTYVPDGMKLATNDTLFCNGPGGVQVFSPQGKCLGTILFPEKSANFCFGGVDRDWLYVTASTRLYRIKTNVKGPGMIPGR